MKYPMVLCLIKKDWKVIMTAFLAFGIYSMLNPVFVFIHEYSHALVAVATGGTVIDVIVGFDYGGCLIQYDVPLEEIMLPLLLFSMAGGLSITTLILAASAFYRPIAIFSSRHIIYAFWEVLSVGTVTWQTIISREILSSAWLSIRGPLTFIITVLFFLYATRSVLRGLMLCYIWGSG